MRPVAPRGPVPDNLIGVIQLICSIIGNDCDKMGVCRRMRKGTIGSIIGFAAHFISAVQPATGYFAPFRYAVLMIFTRFPGVGAWVLISEIFPTG